VHQVMIVQTYKLSASDSKSATPVEEKSLADYDNLIQLSNLNEALILHNLRERFIQDKIYTYISSILVAVNPFRMLPIYTPEVLEKYKDGGWRNESPHIYAIADNSYASMLGDDVDQAVVISGESGAGKTETMKLVLQFIAEVSSRASKSAKADGTKSESLEQQILKSNPVMEAFGNAKTTRNNNSSRFGKWTEITFSASGAIMGGSIVNYLLEKSRIPFQAELERNYHVFYELIAGGDLDPSLKAKLSLKEPDSYHYMNQSGVTTVDNINDEKDWLDMISAMDVLNWTQEMKDSTFQILAGILWLGNVEFEKDPSGAEDDSARVRNEATLEKVAELLQVDVAAFKECLCYAKLKIAGSVTLKQYSLDSASVTRDATSKEIYGRLFDSIIDKINETLGGKEVKAANPSLRIIGVLDIFGFESFPTNSFEQLCINFCNEKLQFHFNEHIFRIEQEEYEKEGIDVSAIEFADNQPTLDMLEAKSTGIFAMIDEEINVPKGSDLGFLSKVLKAHAKHSNFKKPKPKDLNADKVFVVVHYAGAVPYNCTDFLTKNQDSLHEDIVEVLSSSADSLLAGLMSSGAAAASSGKKKKKMTLGAKFKKSLNSLMDTLNKCSPHFVRCMKPNSVKKGGVFESPMMLAQLRYAGLLEVCRIRQVGYPVRKAFDDFLFRYRPLASRVVSSHTELLADLSSQGLAKDKEWQVGHSKVFMRNAQQQAFEEARETSLHGVVVRIQKIARRFVERCRYMRFSTILAGLRAAVASRDEDELDSALADASDLPHGGAHLQAVKDARALKERLEEEQNVDRLLAAAMQERDLASLQSAVAAATNMVPPYNPSSLGDAQVLVDAIKQEQATLEQLRSAINARDLAAISAGLAAADGLGAFVTADDTYKQAVTLKARLQEEARVKSELQAAVSGRHVEALINCIDLMVNMGMEDPLLDEARVLKKELERQVEALSDLRDAVAKRSLPMLQGAVEQADNVSLSADTEEYKDAKTLIERLNAETQVIKGLQAAMGSDDLGTLQSALDAANALSPPLSATVPDNDALRTVAKKLEQTKAFTGAKKQLKEACAAGTLAALSAAISKATEIGLPACDELSEARTKMDAMGDDAKVLTAISDAVQGGDLEAIQNAIDEAEGKGLGDEASVADARKQLMNLKKLEKLSAQLLESLDSGITDRKKLSKLLIECQDLGLGQRNAALESAAKARLSDLERDSEFMDMIDAARKNGNPEGIDEAVAKGQSAGASDAVAAHAARAKELIELEADLNQRIDAAMESKDMAALQQMMDECIANDIENSKTKDMKLLLGRAGNQGKIKQALAEAVEKVDQAKLNEYLGKALEAGIEGPEVEAAKALAETLTKDKELAQGVRAAMKTLENKVKSKPGILPEDLGELDAALTDAIGKGLSPDSPYVTEANEFKSKMERVLVVQEDLKELIAAPELKKLKAAMDRADDLGLASLLMRDAKKKVRELERERARAAMDDDEYGEDGPSLDDDELKKAREEKMEKARNPRFHFTKYSKIRNPNDFVKGLMFGKSKAKAQQLRWQNTVANRSLIEFDSKDLNKQAQRLHKNLLGYTGDRSMSFPPTLAQDTLTKGLEMPELVDEVYMQLCKHLTHNPRPESQVRAWQVMCMCVGTFPPSRDFENYLLNFILEHVEGNGAVGNYARYSLRRLEGILNSGPSGFVPSVNEIQAYKERPPILATIELVDGTPLTEELPITPDLNVAKVLDICTHFMELQDPRMQYFGVFVEDVDEEGEDAPNPLAKAGIAERLQKTPRPLQNENFMGDVVTVKVRQNQKFKFVFKRKIFLKNQDEPSEDPMFSRLVYLQAVDEVIKGNIPVDDEEEVGRMVSDFMAVEFGEEMPDDPLDLTDPNHGQLIEYVPMPWREHKDEDDWAEVVLKYRMDSISKDPEELQNEVVEAVKDHPLYGTSFFHVKKNKFPERMDDFPDRLILAYNSEGLHFLDENRDTLASFGYADIYRWGGSSTQFSLIIWNPETQDTDDLSMYTSQAADMAGLILDYINAIMATTEE